MREFVKSSFSLGLALSLFAFKQFEDLLAPRDSAEPEPEGGTKALESIRNAAVEQLDGTLRSTFSALDNVQRGFFEIGFSLLSAPVDVASWRRSDGRENNGSVRDSRTSAFCDESSFDSRRATILRTRKARDDERFTGGPEEIIIGRRS